MVTSSTFGGPPGERSASSAAAVSTAATAQAIIQRIFTSSPLRGIVLVSRLSRTKESENAPRLCPTIDWSASDPDGGRGAPFKLLAKGANEFAGKARKESLTPEHLTRVVGSVPETICPRSPPRVTS